MSSVTEIKIVFENCMYGTVPAKYIKGFCLDGIKDSINFFHNEDSELVFHKKKVVEKIFIKIDKFAAKLNLTFGVHDEDKLFDRILDCQDITIIELKFSDDTEEEFLPVWEGSQYENDLQTSHVDNNGNLVIKIGDIDD